MLVAVAVAIVCCSPLANDERSQELGVRNWPGFERFSQPRQHSPDFLELFRDGSEFGFSSFEISQSLGDSQMSIKFCKGTGCDVQMLQVCACCCSSFSFRDVRGHR